MPPSSSRPKSKARLAAYQEGQRGEALAAWYLRLKLYRIIASRYKTAVGEIDLVAERFGTLVFVEVKARRTAARPPRVLSCRSVSRAGMPRRSS